MEVNSILPHKIFLYGTLKRGQPNYYHLIDQTHGLSRFSSVAVTDTAYPLVITTRWNIPFLLDAPGKGQVTTTATTANNYFSKIIPLAQFSRNGI